jgi:hypothetical protein
MTAALETFHEATLTLSVDQMRKSTCVYAHYVMPENTLFFIGVCKLTDVYRHPDAFRNHHWIETVKDDTVIRTVVVQTSLQPIDCIRYQNILVKQYRPICNVVGQRIAGRFVITCLEGPNAGKTYTTTTQAAYENGMSQPTLSNHLNGRRGYETVRGMKFKRGLA